MVNKQVRLKLLDKVLEDLEKEELENYANKNELKGLFEREQQLWEMTFNSKDMDKLRDRQLQFLYDLIQCISSSSSKAAADGMQNSNVKKQNRNDIKRICGKCKSLLDESRLVLLGRKDIPDICRRCDSLHKLNKDENVYREILRGIRRDERRSGALASFAFIIQEQDVQYLVETVWHGHSILSQTTDRQRLRLPRFIQSEDWAPWNCILLSETEAKTHQRLRDFSEVYQEHLLKIIQSRNSLALTAFRRLRAVGEEFVESGQWWSADGGGDS